MSKQIQFTEVTLALEFGTNLFGKLKPEIKKRLQAVIDNPCQETWEDTYSIILTFRPVITLWQAVLKVDKNMPIRRRSGDAKWDYVPNSKTIIKAIKEVIFNPTKEQLN